MSGFQERPGRTASVTGSVRGVGEAAVHAPAERAARVHVTAHDLYRDGATVPRA
ncbi:hypothetical protein GTW52_21575 [Streptomyces sp. SID8358]|uniref:hypothetical protein n=1 Tax=unclassified Streptomyces TaxID=2593676 RepID=UPI00081B8925|nr:MULTISPECIES: hypothetical protein [unclassified Streptomyces]MYU35668.1 hypothetical protein [Streptomyces sp. SID8358]SCD92898.1 hypothetical protein GA0115239_11236 [Streptomyces sp. BpilaLS-43]